MKNLLFTTTFYYPYVSGLTIHVQRIAENFAGKKYHVQVVTSQHDKKLPLNEERDHVRVKRIPYLFKVSKGVFMPFYVFHILPQILKADTVVVSLPQFDALFTAVMSKVLRRKLICLYVCQLKFDKNLSGAVIGTIMRMVEWGALSLADKIITLTKDYTESSRTLTSFRNKTEHIYPLIKKPHSPKNIKNTLGSSKYIIGMIGRISREKGVEYLIKAIPFIKKILGDNFVIFIAGPKDTIGEDQYKNRIINLINENKKNIKLIGFLEKEQLGSFYSSVDVLVFPSVDLPEVFGIVQVEAMLSGTPVAASNIPGVRVPVMTTGMGELFNPKDPHDMAKKIIKVLSNSKKYTKYKTRAEIEFDFRKSANKYEESFIK